MCEQERERLPWENNEETRTEAIAALEPVCMATRKRLSSQSSGGWERCWSSQLVKANQLSFLSLSLSLLSYRYQLNGIFELGSISEDSPAGYAQDIFFHPSWWELFLLHQHFGFSLSLLLTGRRREIPQRPGGWYISFARPKDFSDHLYISYPFIFTVKWDNTQSAYTVFCLMNRYISLSPKKHSNSPPSEFAGPET